MEKGWKNTGKVHLRNYNAHNIGYHEESKWQAQLRDVNGASNVWI